jgi:hypothetical protein
MATLYVAHVGLRDNPEGAKLYLQEICEAINGNMPTDINSDLYTEYLRKIWKGVIGDHTSRYWFPLNLIVKHSKQVAREHHQRNRTPASYIPKGEQQADDVRARVGNWTIEGARAAIAQTQAEIDSGALPANIGQILIRIPQKAIERLTEQNRGEGIPDLGDL